MSLPSSSGRLFQYAGVSSGFIERFLLSTTFMGTSKKNLATNLQELAFWHWEYQRRNPVYIQWSKEIQGLRRLFSAHDIVSISPQKNSMTPFRSTQQNSKKDYCTANFYEKPYSLLLKSTISNECDFASHVYKYHIPSISEHLDSEYDFCGEDLVWPEILFQQKFGRFYRASNDGMNSDDEFNSLIKNKDISLLSNNPLDLAALSFVYHDWNIQLNGKHPKLVPQIHIARENFTLSAQAKVGDFNTIANEIYVARVLLDLFTDGYAGLCKHVLSNWCNLDQEKQETKPGVSVYTLNLDKYKGEVLETIKKLLGNLSNINTSTRTRLAGLWMWDEAMKLNPIKLDDVFDDVYLKIVHKIDTVEIKSLKQFDTPQRAKDILLRTDECIQSMRLLKFTS